MCEFLSTNYCYYGEYMACTLVKLNVYKWNVIGIVETHWTGKEEETKYNQNNAFWKGEQLA